MKKYMKTIKIAYANLLVYRWNKAFRVFNLALALGFVCFTVEMVNLNRKYKTESLQRLAKIEQVHHEISADEKLFGTVKKDWNLQLFAFNTVTISAIMIVFVIYFLLYPMFILEWDYKEGRLNTLPLHIREQLRTYGYKV